jgi:hypothetical protein
MSAVRSAWAAGAPPWVALRPLASGCTWSHVTSGVVPRSGERVRLFSDLPAPPTFCSYSVLARSPFAPSCGPPWLPGALVRSLFRLLARAFPPAQSRRSPAPAATAWRQWRATTCSLHDDRQTMTNHTTVGGPRLGVPTCAPSACTHQRHPQNPHSAVCTAHASLCRQLSTSPFSPPSPNLASERPHLRIGVNRCVCCVRVRRTAHAAGSAPPHHPQPYVSPHWYPSPPRPPSLRPSATLQFIGLLLECIVEDVASPDNQGEDAHLTLYSAHDRTIIALLSALGLHGVAGAAFPSYCRGPTYSSPLSHRAVVVAPGPRSRIRPRRPRP